jgi:hypothetical protein
MVYFGGHTDGNSWIYYYTYLKSQKTPSNPSKLSWNYVKCQTRVTTYNHKTHLTLEK